MLNSIRKFSSSPYAKVLLGIVILPFILWGMGDVFRGGSQNTIIEMEGKKISAQDFGDYVNTLNLQYEQIDDEIFNKLLSNFIAKNLIASNAKNLEINITDKSLAKILQNNINFNKDNNFSRTKYEKFLITSNLTAFQFEKHLKDQEIKDQLFNFISGGIRSPDFLINQEYDAKNQIRNILYINLNNYYKDKLLISDSEIKKYYEENIIKFSENFKTIKYSKITPRAITGKDEFSNSFFDALDNIEDLIASELNLEQISERYELEIKETDLFNINGKKQNGEEIKNLSAKIIGEIFKLNSSDNVFLISDNENYLLVNLNKDKNMPKKVSSNKIKSEISTILKRKVINVENSKIIEKIITNKFTKTDFDLMAKNNNLKMTNIELKGVTDNKLLSNQMVENIYLLPEKKMYIFTDFDLNKNILVYIEKIKHVKIDIASEDYKKFNELVKSKLTSRVYKTYDEYLTNKYDVNINNKAIERVKNFFK